MESLLDTPVTLLPVFLALMVIAAIGAGVIVMTTLSSARQNKSLYAPVGSGQQQVPQGELSWDQRRSEPIPHVTGQGSAGQGSPFAGGRS
jgi:hypothetical protein